jgi:hypothetical protein
MNDASLSIVLTIFPSSSVMIPQEKFLYALDTLRIYILSLLNLNILILRIKFWIKNLTNLTSLLAPRVSEQSAFNAQEGKSYEDPHKFIGPELTGRHPRVQVLLISLGTTTVLALRPFETGGPTGAGRDQMGHQGLHCLGHECHQWMECARKNV